MDPGPFLTPLTRHFPIPALALDVGCGSGRDQLWLKQRGYNVLDLERSPGLAELARILQALNPGGHVLPAMKQGQGTSTARDRRVFVPRRDQDVRGVFAELGLAVLEAFTNVSVLGMGERRIGYVAENRLRNSIGQGLALLAH